MARGLVRCLAVVGLAVAVHGSALACDLRLAHRSAVVADYVEAVQPCLSAPPPGYVIDPDMEAEFLARVNAERTARGLRPLRLRPRLAAAARVQSLDMAYNAFFGHVGPDGRHPQDRIAAFDRRALIKFSAENVAMVEAVRGRWNPRRKGVAKLHRNLMDSEVHRNNILKPDITDIAIGVVRTERGVWVTELFLDLEGSLPRDVPVRMWRGQKVGMTPALRDWTFQHFEAGLPNGKYWSLKTGVPPGLAGNVRLSAFSRMPGDAPGRSYTIRLPGPAVTVMDQ